MPLVSFDAMRQAFFRDAGATYGDIAYLTKPAGWKFQVTTPNAATPYVYLNFNVKDGPWILDFPAAEGAGLFGCILDAWQLPMNEVGPAGDDQGRGGKYLILPPDFEGDVPSGYLPVRSATYNGYCLFRAIPASQSAADNDRAIALIKKLRLYPLAEAASPRPQRHIDVTGRPFEGIAIYNDTFMDSLAKMVDEEPVRARDMVAMAQLRTLGIEKGKAFNPDAPTRAVLKAAVEEAHAEFMDQVTPRIPYWPGSKWGMSVAIDPKTGLTFENDSFLDIDARALMYFMVCAPPKVLGKATFYLINRTDTAGAAFEGSKSYHLRVPPNVPAAQFWAVTAYDLETAGFMRESPKVEVNSYQNLQKNADGSTDVYFGPIAPAGKESNWVHTVPGRQWFAFFRWYGPQPAIFDRSWVLPDIEVV